MHTLPLRRFLETDFTGWHASINETAYGPIEELRKVGELIRVKINATEQARHGSDDIFLEIRFLTPQNYRGGYILSDHFNIVILLSPLDTQKKNMEMARTAQNEKAG